MVFRVLIFALLSVREGWIWYKDTSLDTIDSTRILKYKLTPSMSDTLPQIEDSLPLDPNTPEPIRRLILNPTVDNAMKYIVWMYRIHQRAMKVSTAVQEAAKLLGIDYSNNLVGQHYENELKKQYTDSIIKNAAREGMLIAYLDSKSSKYYVPLLEMVFKKYKLLSIVVVDKYYLLNTVLPVKLEKGEMAAIGIRKPPALLFYKPDKNEVFVLSRTLIDIESILFMIKQVEEGLWPHISLHF